MKENSANISNRLLSRILQFAGCLLGCFVLLAGILPSTAFAISKYQVETPLTGVMIEGDIVHFRSHKACYVVENNGVVSPCPFGCEKIQPECPMSSVIWSMITADNHTYGLGGNGALFLWTPGEENPWKYITRLEEVENVVYDHAQIELSYDFDGTTLFERIYNQKTTVVETYCYDIETGERKKIHTARPYEFGPAAVHPDGGIVFEGYSNGMTTLVRLTSNGETEVVCKTEFFPDQLYGIVYDQAGGWYLLTENKVWHLDGEGKLEVVNQFSRTEFDWCTQLAYLPVQHAVSFSGSDPYHQLVVPLYMEERHILSINGKTDRIGSAFSLLPYENRHLNVSVELRDSLFEFDDLAQALNTGNLEDDLFVVSTYDDGLYRMKDKRYFYDLSGDPELAAYVDSLCPAWREAVTTPDGKIAALPLMAEGYYRLCYRGSLWEKLNLGEVPRTWDEMLDTLQRWYDDGILQDVRLFSSGNTFRQMALQLLKNNAARYAARGETPRYQDETLLRLLNRLLDMRPMLDEYDGWNVYGDYLLRSDVGYGLQFSPDSVFSDLLDLPLGMDGPDDYAYLMDLYAFIINPRFQQPELALQFLRETLHDRHPSQEWKLVQPGEELGLINQAVLDSIAASEETIAQVQAIYDQTDDPASRDVLLQAYIQPAERGLAAYADERTHWYVTPEADLFYRNVMAHLAINTASGYRLMWENASSAINAFLDGKTGPEALVRKLDEVVRMWEMENQ